MRARRILVILAVLVIGTQITLRMWPRAEQTPNHRLYRLLVQEKALNDGLKKPVAQMLSLLDPPVDAVVNEPYAAGRLHVYVVNLDVLPSAVSLRSLGIDSRGTLQESLARNVIAIPPNVMLIDDSFLAFLMTDAMNDALGMVQTSMAVEKAFERATDLEAVKQDPALLKEIERYQTAGIYQRLVNLDGLSHRRGRDRFRSLGEQHGIVMARQPNIRYSTLLANAISPLIAHELSHLRSSKAGEFEISQVLGFGNVLKREEERHADSVARDYVERRVRNATATYAKDGDQYLLDMELQPLIWFGKLMAERALAEMFEGFRGLTALQVLVDIDQRECGADGMYPISARGFASSRLLEIPILTETEWREMRTRVEERAESTHDLHIARAIAYLEPIHFGGSGLAVSVEDEARFFYALVSDDPGVLFELPAEAPLPVASEAVFALLRPVVRLERAAAFDRNGTRIGTFPTGGYVEVRTSGEQVSHIRFVVVRRPIGQSDADAVVRQFFAMLKTITLAAGVTPAEGERAIVQLSRPKDPECRGQTREMQLGSATVTYRNLLQTEAFLIEVARSTK